MDTFLRLPAAGSLARPQVGSYTAAVVTTPATITGWIKSAAKNICN